MAGPTANPGRAHFGKVAGKVANVAAGRREPIYGA